MIRNDRKTYTLYVMGSRGSRPVHGREFEKFGGQTTCFIVKSGSHAVIVDCGTGLYDAENILRDCDIIDIVFTHFHYDHIIGMLDGSIFPRGARISLFGAYSNNNQSTGVIDDFYRTPFWPITPRLGAVCDITNDGTPYPLADGFTVSVYRANHPDGGNFILLTIGDKKLCFMFDMELAGISEFDYLKGCDFLIFDGMFDESEYLEHRGWGHSTYQDGCRLANVYDCKELLITHHNPHNDDKKLLAFEENAKKLFPRTRFCRAGDIFAIDVDMRSQARS